MHQDHKRSGRLHRLLQRLSNPIERIGSSHISKAFPTFSKLRNYIRLSSLPVTVGLSLSTGSLFLWWALHEAEQSHFQQSIEQKTEALSVEISEQIEPKILALGRMARHWEQEGGLTRENWELEARLNIEDFRGYEAIAWADATSQIRWAVTAENSVANRTALPSLKLDSDPNLRRALAQARTTGTLAITPYLDWQGGQDEFFVVVPIMGAGTTAPATPCPPGAGKCITVASPVAGYIVGIFQAQTLFHTLLDEGDVQGYVVQIFSQDRQLYSHQTEAQLNNPTLLQETTITLYNLNWQLQVAPTQALWLRSQTYLSAVSLLSGLSLSWLLALAIYLAQSSDRAAKTAHTTALRLKATNQELEHEIHERQQAEEEVKQAQKFLQTVVDNVPVALFVKDGRPSSFGQFKLWNKASEQIFGVSSHAAIGATDHDFFPTEQADSFRQKDIQTFEQGTLEDIPEEVICRRNLDDSSQPYSERLLHTIKVPIFSDRHEPEYLLCISQDITEKKQAESLLQQSLKELADFKFALDTSSIVAITNADGIIQYVNEKFCQISHYDRTELLGQTHHIINSGHHPPEFFDHLWATITQGQVWHGEICNRTKHGDQFWVDATLVPLLDEQGTPLQYIAISIDITEKKLLEKQFLRVQRMESLGTLAGGIAHDLNNVLSPIMMAVQLLKQQEQDTETQQWLEIMEGSAQRGADLIKQVLAFARGTEGDRTALQLSDILYEIKRILDETFPKNITLHVDIAGDLWPVLGDTTQLHQVFMNLCINARDAMPQGGTLAITARNLHISNTDAQRQPELQAGHYVETTVSDTGMGIAPSILDRIFEPFFTTKEFGKGTGMGLSTVMGIIKSHEGLITVSSQPQEGSQFRVYLPATQQGVKAIAPTAPLPEGHGELILVIDDEAALCEMARSTLQSRRYQVITAHSGAEALRLYPQYGDAIGLVLVDMMMPDIDGATTIKQLHQLNPALKFIIMSGLITKPDLSAINDAAVVKILAKPFTTSNLVVAISQALAQKPH